MRSYLINYLRIILRKIYLNINDTKDINKIIDTLKITKNAAADAGDLLSIYKMVIQLKPKNILELGPGISTNAICIAILKIQESDKNYKPNFIALEESKKWLDYHKKHLPKEFNKIVKLRHEKMIIQKDENGNSYSFYENIPTNQYDFIHLDGPSTLTYSTDIIRIWKNINKKCYIIVDGRENTARTLLKILPDLKYKRHLFTLSYHLYV